MRFDLIDCHLHLQDPAIKPHLPQILSRASESGVRLMVCNGTCEDDWPAVAELARTHRQIVPCFGLHPWYVPKRSADWLARLETFLRATPSGVGEIGLDRWIEPRDEPAQEQAFRAQLALARQLGRPVMIHCLRAWGWLMDVLRDEPPLPQGMLIHAFGGSPELIAPLAEMGAYFSFAGNIFEEKRHKARETLQTVPIDRLLIETDAPDMLPPPDCCTHAIASDGRLLNEPANLPAIFPGIAQLRNVDPQTFAGLLRANAHRLLAGLIRNADRAQ